MLRAKSRQLFFYGNHIYDRVIPDNHLQTKPMIAIRITAYSERRRAHQPSSLRRIRKGVRLSGGQKDLIAHLGDGLQLRWLFQRSQLWRNCKKV